MHKKLAYFFLKFRLQVLDSRSLEVAYVKLDGENVKYQIEDANFLGEKIIVCVGERKAGDKLYAFFLFISF